MNMTTVSFVLMLVGAVVVLANFFIFNRVSWTNTATAEQLAARLEVAYSSLQRDIDKLEQLRSGAAAAGGVDVMDTAVARASSSSSLLLSSKGGGGGADTNIPAVVDCVGQWSAWGPCSEGCGVGSRSRKFTVTTVKHGPGGRDCPVGNNEVDSRQCSAQDCADIAASVLDAFCPGASCDAVLANSYCEEEYGQFCATHDGLAQPLPPPPGFTIHSTGCDLCPKSCDGHAGHVPHSQRPLAHAEVSAAASPRVAAAGAAASQPSAQSNSNPADGMTEAQLIDAMKAVYPSDDVAAAGNYMGVHDPHVLQLSDALGNLRAARVKAAMKWNWGMYVKCAFGKDELLPQTCKGQDNWGGFAFTLVDALDTLWFVVEAAVFFRYACGDSVNFEIGQCIFVLLQTMTVVHM